MLAALKVVDAVVIFDENTPLELFSAIKSDLVVKGADYKTGLVMWGAMWFLPKAAKFVFRRSSLVVPPMRCWCAFSHSADVLLWIRFSSEGRPMPELHPYFDCFSTRQGERGALVGLVA